MVMRGGEHMAWSGTGGEIKWLELEAGAGGQEGEASSCLPPHGFCFLPLHPVSDLGACIIPCLDFHVNLTKPQGLLSTMPPE